MQGRLDVSRHFSQTIAPFELSGTALRRSSDDFLPRMPRPNLAAVRAIPRARSRAGAKRTRQAHATPATVLVVDDVADVTEMLALFLKRAGYDVATADSASTALRLARSRKFDLVISDIGMPEMNGYQLVGALRAMPNYDAIPMIAVTGYSEYDDRGRTLRAGFSAHLTKPIDPAGLLDLIKSLLG